MFVKNLLRSGFVLAVLTVALLMIGYTPASALTPPIDDSLVFQLTSSDTAMAPEAIPAGDGDTLIVVQFGIARGGSTRMMEFIEGSVAYDTDEVTLIGVEVDTAVWPYDFKDTVITEGDDTHTRLTFTDTSGTGVGTSDTPETFATLTFKVNCGGEAGTSPITFLGGAGENNRVLYVGLPTGHYPGSTANTVAAKTLYEATYSIHNAIFTGCIGDTVDVPVYLESNARSYSGCMKINFQSSKLEYVGYIDGDYPISGVTNWGDTTLGADYQNMTGMPAFTTEDTLFTLQFVLQPDMWGDTTGLDFVESVQHPFFPRCDGPKSVTWNNGTISSGDFAPPADDYLTFALESDTAMPPVVCPDDDTLLVIPFRIKKTNAGPGSVVESAKAYIAYDSDKLTLVSTAADESVWPYSFGDTTVSEGDTTFVVLSFDAPPDSGILLTSSYQTFGNLTFKLNCVANGDSAYVDFGDGYDRNWIDFGGDSAFAPGTFESTFAHSELWVASLTIPHDTITVSAGDTVRVPVSLKSNFRAYWYEVWIDHDTAKLEYLSCDLPAAEYGWLGVGAYTRSDTAIVMNLTTNFSIDSIYYPAHLDEDVLYTVNFLAKCDLWNDSTLLSFMDTTFCVTKCMQADVADSLVDGSITDEPAAKYLAEFSGDPVGKLDVMTWDILLSSTFSAGDATTSHGDTGVVVNVNLHDSTEYEGYSSLNDSLSFAYRMLNFRNVSLIQIADSSLGNNVGPGDTQDMVQLEVELIGDISTTPTWSAPYILDVPEFVVSNAASLTDARVTDAQCDGTADSASGMLTWSPFDTAIAAVCQFYNTSDITYKPKTETIEIWVRSNVDAGAFEVKVTVDTNNYLSVVSTETGVSDSAVGRRAVLLSTGMGFAGCAKDGSVKLAEVRLTQRVMLLGAYAYLTYSDMEGTKSAAGHHEMYTDYSVGAVRFDCGFWKPESDGLPTVFALSQNYPNPFNPTTVISLALPEASDWSIEIFNILGQRVERFEGSSEPGTVEVQWDGSQVASGVYLYRATAGEFRETKKMLLMK